MKTRRTHYQADPFTREINRRLPELLSATVVVAVLPDGKELVAKGDHRWISDPRTIRLNAPNREAAAVLKDTLADDGFNAMEEGHA